MKYWGLRILLVLSGAATFVVPLFISPMFTQKAWVPFGALLTLEVVAFYVTRVVSNAISREDFSRWSYIVKRAYGNLEVGYVLANFRRQEGVRITLFIPHKRKKGCLVQLVPYYPSGEFGSSRRRLHVDKGIVGKAYRSGKALRQVVNSPVAYRRELVSKWGFSEKEAKNIRTDRRAFIALPVFRSNDTIGAVVFLDAKSPAAFSRKDRVRILQRVCVAIAKWA